ncbi:Trp biosynthesis-associated membrane protein [Amycolatopsis cihanbeyliensis]|uniref:Putative membrane protein (TIGR02234 family) n=1 Tax=Amycolatopsis cihanbeyliensis TaxID=1128664 RepID=A0A542DG87_AMYCI|nr:Trp biosynthesis-associated membrane protein [Amycolatopsis cihanbeyliensis]TQJ02086.1 putative membrane protein (TIGR02234 family) [Amycolatopsis cihanbeyliensis]
MVGLLLGAAALWGASRLAWFAENRVAGVRGTVLHTETGAQAAGALVPLAVLALAGVAGMVATGGWARRVLGGALVLAGLAACWVAVNGLRTDGYPDGAPVAEIYVGHGLAAFGGVLVVVAGVLGLRGATRMPRMGARYSAPAAKRSAAEHDYDLWDALSDGRDPTAGR